MYLLINAETANATPNRDDADEKLANIKQIDPTTDWKLFSPVSESTPQSLERLYALADYLLRVSKVDPTKLEMKLTNLLDEVETFTAMKVMIDARIQLDETETYPELLDTVKFCIERVTDPLIRARLMRAIRT